MRTMFDPGIVGRSGPFLGLNLPKLIQDAQPVYQAARTLIKNQGSGTTTPTAQPSVVPAPAPVDNSMTYLVLGALGLGGAAAAWYFFRKKPGSKKK